VRVITPATLEVRRRLPPLSRRQVSRLPDALQADHARWVTQAPPGTELGLRDQARQLALTMIELGEDGASTERQLHRWRFHPALASDAATWALAVHAARTEALAAAGAAGAAGAVGALAPVAATSASGAPAGVRSGALRRSSIVGGGP
jgi:hypothetical protein